MNKYLSHGECLRRWPQLRSLRELRHVPKNLDERWELNQLESIVRLQSPDCFISKSLVYALVEKYKIKQLPLATQPSGKESFRDFINKYPVISHIYDCQYSRKVKPK